MSTTLWSPSEVSYVKVPLSSSSSSSPSNGTESGFKRSDGRKRLGYRDLSIETSTSLAQGAVASSVVTIGDSNSASLVDCGGETRVEAGVRAEVDTVQQQGQRQPGGKIVVNVEW